MKFVHFVSAFSKDNVAARSDTYGGSSHVTCHDGEDRDGEIDRSVKSEMEGSSDGKAGGDKIAINCTAWPNDELCAINCNFADQPLQEFSTTVRDFVSSSIPASTKRAYASDLASYTASGRQIPSSHTMLLNTSPRRPVSTRSPHCGGMSPRSSRPPCHRRS